MNTMITSDLIFFNFGVLTNFLHYITLHIGTQEICCPKCHFLSVQNHQLAIFRPNFVQNCEFRFFIQNAKFHDFIRFSSKTTLLYPYRYIVVKDLTR